MIVGIDSSSKIGRAWDDCVIVAPATPPNLYTFIESWSCCLESYVERFSR